MFDEPVDALIYATVSENITEQQAQAAIKRLQDYFVDFNDLRVASIDEMVEVIGKDLPSGQTIARTLANSLRAVFEKYNMLSLQSIKKLGKRPAKLILEKITAATPFVINYCMLTALQGHAIPLTSAMIEYLKTNMLVDANAGYEEIEGFLSRQITTKNAYDFYFRLRHECESPKKKKTRKRK